MPSFSEDQYTVERTVVVRDVHGDETRYPIAGRLDPRFDAVLDAFTENFSRGLETGASFSLVHKGQLVADLWGGYSDANCTTPWQADTLCNVMSVTKAMTATCLHLLVDRGEVDLDAPVARYWPSFSANGKSGIRVRWLLDNRAGLPVLDDDLWPGAIFDWHAMVDALAAQPALFKPGGTPAYHIRTAGFLVGELVRRVSGQSLGSFFQCEIAEPHGIDFHIGLGRGEIARCAEFIAQKSGTLQDAGLHAPASLVARSARQFPNPIDYNADAYRLAEIPSTNGHGNGRAVARFYDLLQSGRILKPPTLAAALVEQHRERECVMGRTYRQALGYLLNTPGDFEVGPGENTFGLLGAGGALGFADPDARIGFGYVENRMHAAMGLGERAPRLIAAAYESLRQLGE